jgi:hypothetical protein
MSSQKQLPIVQRVQHPGFCGNFGVARRDITPPPGIYSRMWGSAEHEVALGVHRPLTATVLAIGSDKRQKPLVFVSGDLGWWRSREDEWFVRGALLERFGLDESQLLLHLTHTHAGPSISLHASDKPGGHLIRPYLESVRNAVADGIDEAMKNSVPATWSWHTGRCQLACFRDQADPHGTGTIVGYAPNGPADDTLLVGRVTDRSGNVIATMVNYACHPTTLGGENRLISPDFVGAMREVVEQSTHGAPCLFLNGAAGDLAPRRQYVGDVAIADQNGRQLGHAALATLADMLPPDAALAFDGIEESTARLGRWKLVEQTPSNASCVAQIPVELPVLSFDKLELTSQQLEGCDRATIERMERLILWSRDALDTPTAPLPIWFWRLGNVSFVALPAEMHSPFQIELRKRFPNDAVVVMNLVNGSNAYLPPRADFERDTYQCNTTLFQPGSHEKVLEACYEALQGMTEGESASGELAAPHFLKSPATQTVEQ